MANTEHKTVGQKLQNPGVSGLSIILTASYDVQRSLLQQLSASDVVDLRLANRTLNYTLSGYNIETNPGQPFNSITNLIGEPCTEHRYAPNPATDTEGHGGTFTPCTTLPLDGITIKPCSKIPDPPLENKDLDQELNRHRHPHQKSAVHRMICEPCQISVRNNVLPAESNLFLGVHTSVCKPCEAMEERRHPEGYYSCTCIEALQGGWMCWRCRTHARSRSITKHHKEHIKCII